MKKQFIVGVLFFSGLWGVSEVLLGELLYKAQLGKVLAPVLLSVIAFAIMTMARVTLRRNGVVLLIGAFVMLYKIVGMGLITGPVYSCHLLGIYALAAGFELTWVATRGRYKPLIGAAGTALGFVIFAVFITYVFRYRFWNTEKFVHYLLIPGSITAGINLFVVPLTALGMKKLEDIETASHTRAVPRWAFGAVSGATLGMWIFSIVLGLAS
ncbi:MAG: hypothetical protein KAR11_09085 [Phycisphaerae bacterium]|nr:hypothetical protein [Phycisphaerae bacterium]